MYEKVDMYMSGKYMGESCKHRPSPTVSVCATGKEKKEQEKDFLFYSYSALLHSYFFLGGGVGCTSSLKSTYVIRTPPLETWK